MRLTVVVHRTASGVELKTTAGAPVRCSPELATALATSPDGLRLFAECAYVPGAGVEARALDLPASAITLPSPDATLALTGEASRAELVCADGYRVPMSIATLCKLLSMSPSKVELMLRERAPLAARVTWAVRFDKSEIAKLELEARAHAPIPTRESTLSLLLDGSTSRPDLERAWPTGAGRMTAVDLAEVLYDLAEAARCPLHAVAFDREPKPHDAVVALAPRLALAPQHVDHPATFTDAIDRLNACAASWGLHNRACATMSQRGWVVLVVPERIADALMEQGLLRKPPN